MVSDIRLYKKPMVSKKENHRFIEANALLLAKSKQIKQTLLLLA